MNKEEELRATEYREQRVDDALKETFPASDPPSFVGAGAPRPMFNKAGQVEYRKAAETAGDIIDQHADLSASPKSKSAGNARV
jgi:hypothetical protein